MWVIRVYAAEGRLVMYTVDASTLTEAVKRRKIRRGLRPSGRRESIQRGA